MRTNMDDMVLHNIRSSEFQLLVKAIMSAFQVWFKLSKKLLFIMLALQVTNRVQDFRVGVIGFYNRH